MDGSSCRVSRVAFARLWVTSPIQDVVDRVAWTVRNALPFARKTPVLAVLFAEIARRPDRYAPILTELVSVLAGYDRATSRRLAQALEAHAS